MKIYNCNHESDYESGLMPDVELTDNSFELYPLGYLSEPLLSEA